MKNIYDIENINIFVSSVFVAVIIFVFVAVVFVADDGALGSRLDTMTPAVAVAVPLPLIMGESGEILLRGGEGLKIVALTPPLLNTPPTPPTSPNAPNN